MNDTTVEQRLVELGNGMRIERDVLGIIEDIYAYDPTLEIQYLDPDRASDITDAPYRILETGKDGIKRVVFTTWTLDKRVLQRLIAADTQRHNVMDALTEANFKADQQRKARYQDVMAEANDIAKHILKSPKGSYTFTKEDEEGNKQTVKIEDGAH